MTRKSKRCPECGQPVLVRGKPKNEFEYQHATGCPLAKKARKR